MGVICNFKFTAEAEGSEVYLSLRRECSAVPYVGCAVFMPYVRAARPFGDPPAIMWDGLEGDVKRIVYWAEDDEFDVEVEDHYSEQTLAELAEMVVDLLANGWTADLCGKGVADAVEARRRWLDENPLDPALAEA